MLDRTIPYHSIIMKGDSRIKADVSLAPGYAIRSYRAGDEEAWARLEWSVGDFPSLEAAAAYFAENFGCKQDALKQRMIFATASDGTVVGACMAWKESRGEETASFVHWLVVDPAHQSRGLGRALCTQVMRIFRELGEYEVYLHTQPWSWKALGLYDCLGFRMLKKDTFLHKENEYAQAMNALKPFLSETVYRRLEERAE